MTKDTKAILKGLAIEVGSITIGVIVTIVATMIAYHYWGGWGILGVVAILTSEAPIRGLGEAYEKWKSNRR